MDVDTAVTSAPACVQFEGDSPSNATLWQRLEDGCDRQREAIWEQSHHLQVADSNQGSMGEVRRPRPQHSRGCASNYSQPRQRDRADHKCTGCGKPSTSQETDACPAKTAICHKCSRIGYYSAQCFFITVATNSQGEAQQDAAFLCPVASSRVWNYVT